MVKSSYSTSAYGLFTKKQFLVEGNYNEMLVEEKDWVNIYLNTFITGNEVPGIRFEPRLVVFSVYYMDPGGAGDTQPFYAWRTFYHDIQVISDDLIESVGPQGELAYYDREISSFEYREFIKARDFQMPIDTINSRILWYGLLLKQYQMNSSSSLFYKDLAKQVQSENRIFDPLPLDVRGNIRCITNTSRPVIGLFEVSAAQMKAYKVLTRKDAREIVVSPVEFMVPEPPLGSVENTPPDFWIN
jgi:hypothetical protein